MGTSGTVHMLTEGHVATLSFANPAQRGALTPEMLAALRDRVRLLAEQWPQVRVVILRGAGDTFSSGYAIDRLPSGEALAVKDEIEELAESIEASPLVFVALLRGHAIGAGLDIASACDFRFAERGCRLGITPAKLGIVYTWRAAVRIQRLVGRDAARWLFLTGDLIAAPEARSIGLVTRVFDDPADLERETRDFADVIAARAPLSVSGSKRIFYELERAGLDTLDPAVARELHDLRVTALASPDVAEARQAFAEKRAPRFTGRAR
jgi:enoyl-CoA hydratase/carnithine racemase